MAKSSGNGGSGGTSAEANTISIQRTTLAAIVLGLVSFVAVDLLDSYRFKGHVQAELATINEFVRTISGRLDAQIARQQDDMQAIYRLSLERNKACQQQ